VSAEGNLKTVRAIYDAFERGDVATILDAVTDDVDWSSAAASSAAPWYGRRIGKDAVTDYFRSIGDAIEVLDFTQLSFAANDTEVMVLSQFRMRSRRSGKEAAMHCTIIGAFATTRSHTGADRRTPSRRRPCSSGRQAVDRMADTWPCTATLRGQRSTG